MKLYIEDEALMDLENFQLDTDPCVGENADVLYNLLIDIDESPDILWTLSAREQQNSDPHFNVKTVDSLQAKGFNVSRLRPLSRRLKDFRVIYAFDAEYEDFYVLAIVRKLQAVLNIENKESFNYEPNHPITKRVCELYDAINIPRIKS